jgi:hypothetical protein
MVAGVAVAEWVAAQPAQRAEPPVVPERRVARLAEPPVDRPEQRVVPRAQRAEPPVEPERRVPPPEQRAERPEQQVVPPEPPVERPEQQVVPPVELPKQQEQPPVERAERGRLATGAIREQCRRKEPF